MPYIVTTKRPIAIDAPSITITLDEHSSTPRRYGVVSRVAVGTPEEAVDLCNQQWTHITGDPGPVRDYLLDGSGGTVGPLPDGSLIEVEDTTWMDLFNESGLEWLALGLDPRAITDDFEFSDEARELILAAFNEANR